MSGKRARSNRRLQVVAQAVRDDAAAMRAIAEELADSSDLGDQRAAKFWLGAADRVYRGVDAVPPGVDLGVVRAAARGRTIAAELLDDVVVQAREAGLSWGDLGAATGMTAEGARKRWGAGGRG